MGSRSHRERVAGRLVAVVAACLCLNSRAAELLISVGDSGGYEDGDIIHAFNDRRILDVHAQHVCDVSGVPKKASGHREDDSLGETYLRQVMQYRFERVSKKDVKRTDLFTGESVVLSDKPNAGGEYVHAAAFVERRLKHKDHRVFGEPGREVWYGGHKKADLEALDKVWAQIEERTEEKKEDHLRWPYGEQTLRKYLAIEVEDFDDSTRGELTSPLLGERDGQAVTLRERKHKVDWRNLPGLTDEQRAALEQPGEIKDLRGKGKYGIAAIAVAKSLPAQPEFAEPPTELPPVPQGEPAVAPPAGPAPEQAAPAPEPVTEPPPRRTPLAVAAVCAMLGVATWLILRRRSRTRTR